MLSALRFTDLGGHGTSPVQVPQINVVGLEQLQRPVDGLRNVFGAPAYTWAVRAGIRIEDHAEFRSEKDVIPLSGLLEPKTPSMRNITQCAHGAMD